MPKLVETKRVPSASDYLYPSDLLAMWHLGIRPESSCAVDTETSGLFVDDGARMSTVSIGFTDVAGAWTDIIESRNPEGWNGGIFSRVMSVVDDELSVPVVTFAWPHDQGVADTGKAEDTGYLTMWPDADNLPEHEWLALIAWLKLVGASTGLDFHHAKFDLHICEAGCRRWPGIGVDLSPYCVWDTQNGVSLLWPTGPKVWNHKLHREVPTTSLKPTSMWLWGEGETDEQQVIQQYLRKNKLPAGRWDLMPWSVIAKYAEHDANLTVRLKLRQLRDIERGLAGQWLTGENGKLTVMEAMQRRMDVSLMLFRIERRGLPFNMEGARDAAVMLQERQRGLEAQLPFKPHTLPAAKKFWFDKDNAAGLKLTALAETPTGAAQVNEMIIDKMIAKGVKGAEQWRDIQKIKTADERWYSGYASMTGSDGRLRCSVRQNGTVSSRFSVERVQLQAVPHDYRLSGYSVLEGIPTPRALIAEGVPEGWELWELDLAQAELRVAALFAGCTPMLELIHAGEDLHAATARALFRSSPDDDKWGFHRNVSKRGNFSLIFGSGPESFQDDLEKQTGIRLSLNEATVLVKDWNALYPDFKRAIYKHKGVVEERMSRNKGVGWIETANGERRWFVPGEETHKAFNQRVQPSLAQFGIDWWLWSERYLVEQYSDAPINGLVGRVGMVMTIHDSQILLLPKGEGEKHVKVIVDYGVKLWQDRFPGVPGDIDAKRWGAK